MFVENKKQINGYFIIIVCVINYYKSTYIIYFYAIYFWLLNKRLATSVTIDAGHLPSFMFVINNLVIITTWMNQPWLVLFTESKRRGSTSKQESKFASQFISSKRFILYSLGIEINIICNNFQVCFNSSTIRTDH